MYERNKVKCYKQKQEETRIDSPTIYVVSYYLMHVQRCREKILKIVTCIIYISVSQTSEIENFISPRSFS